MVKITGANPRNADQSLTMTVEPGTEGEGLPDVEEITQELIQWSHGLPMRGEE